MQEAQDGLVIRDHADDALATIYWDAVSTGQTLIFKVLPSVFAVWIMAGLISGGATLHFRSQQQQLEIGTQKVNTAQMPSLLNRSGVVQPIQEDAPFRHLDEMKLFV